MQRPNLLTRREQVNEKFVARSRRNVNDEFRHSFADVPVRSLNRFCSGKFPMNIRSEIVGFEFPKDGAARAGDKKGEKSGRKVFESE